MGDPRKSRKKYSSPAKPWEKQRIDEEREILKEYALKNKKEIWKTRSLLKNFTYFSKKLITAKGPQAQIEKEQLLKRLQMLGLLPVGARLDDVLGLSINDFLERRLQSLVFKKGLARSMKQARQFIVHEHVMVNGKKITVPSYLVSKQEEDLITFAPNSSLVDSEHPERKVEKKVKEVKKEKKDDKPEEEVMTEEEITAAEVE
ncbi:30S ribosomal protein S4 [Candidatus Woesearchaeota archaeon]|nr:30S ribosomal protein S4 [Candidatus Woesearchaeota archaeon]